MQDLPGTAETDCHSVPPAGAETSTTSAQSKPADNAPVNNANVATATAPAKPKKKRANPVYITPVRRERKRSCSDSDNEDYIPGDDGDWAPGKKKGKPNKKKTKSRKAKSPKL